jgi:2-oxo-3-hexenedioate decarboxylase
MLDYTAAMSPQALLAHYDGGTSWPVGHGVAADGDLDHAYETALAVRRLREARGERVAGIKIGWTNRANWSRQGVAAPMWSTLYDTSTDHCGDACAIDLPRTTQPKLEPEIVFGLRAAPAAGATREQVFACLEWLAPGFEIVQSHLPDWRYTPAQTIADGGVHARLVVGRRVPVRELARDGAALDALLARTRVRVSEGARAKGEGTGAIVLDGPLNALHQVLREMQRRPGAPALAAGHVVTTGTWTDAFVLAPGECWRAEFDPPVPALQLTLR